ncbi:MAG TPA: hypothetical protein VFH67_03165 [bacterium]|nr:hypothetical protein [bacterium]
MIHDTNVKADTFKQRWSSLVPKIRDRYPNLSDQDLSDINGDLDKLVAKVSEKHGQSKAEIMNDLTTLISGPEKTVAGNTGSKMGSGSSDQYQQKEGFPKQGVEQKQGQKPDFGSEGSVKEGSEREESTGKKR